MIEGCNVIQALFLIVFPVSAPGIAATALYGFVLSWNEFAYARTFLVINETPTINFENNSLTYIIYFSEISLKHKSG